MVIYLTKNLVLLGMMGVGKSTIGKILSRKSGLKLIDVDKLIEKKEQISISNIFQSKGEGYFRRLEEITTIEILKKNYKKIIALGGGAFINKKIRSSIEEQAVSVWLKADLETLWKRVKHKKSRPLLRTDNPRDTLANIYTDRIKTYSLADIIINSNDKSSLDEMAKLVIKSLLDRKDLIERA